jgi:PilZ domain
LDAGCARNDLGRDCPAVVVAPGAITSNDTRPENHPRRNVLIRRSRAIAERLALKPGISNGETNETFSARGPTGSPPVGVAGDTGRTDQECRVLDISRNGAKVVTEMPSEVPVRFELAFFQSDQKRRACEVIWRRGKMLGVKFL